MATLDEPRAASPGGPSEELKRMSFGDHLDELRKRLIKACAALFVAILAMLPFHDEVLAIIIEPYRILWKRNFVDYAEELEQTVPQKEAAAERERDPKLQAKLQHEAKNWREKLTFVREEREAILDGTYAFPDELQSKTGFKVPYALVAIGGLDDFWTFMQASLLFAAVIASPVVIYQLWAFIAAGLYQRERRLFYQYFPFMIGLLTAGVLFGYFIAVPFALSFLIMLMRIGQVQPMLGVTQYFTILFSLTLALGVMFQLPLVMVALQRVHLITHHFLIKYWRFVVLGIFIAAAVLTPTPDPFNMMVMAVPGLVLYGLGLILTAFGRKHEVKV
jgi:sec-independent protein translocase protein TatC